MYLNFILRPHPEHTALTPDSGIAPDLSVIIVNYNGGDDLLACLRSLASAQEFVTFEVIVVDNESTDGSLGPAQLECPQFAYLRAGENLGFARACNRGLQEAKGRHFMLLNPDTEVMPGALSGLTRALDENPAWGIAGACMVDQRGKPYRAARRFPTPFWLFCEVTKLARLIPWSQALNGYLYGERPIVSLDEVDQVEGSALAIAGRVRAEVGDLDEQFFIFFEEVDWCRRVRGAGYEIHVVPEALIRHKRSAVMSRHYEKIRRIHAESAMKYFRKHHGEPGLKELRKKMRYALLLRGVLMRALSIFGSRKAKRHADAAKAERAVYKQGLPQ